MAKNRYAQTATKNEGLAARARSGAYKDGDYLRGEELQQTSYAGNPAVKAVQIRIGKNGTTYEYPVYDQGTEAGRQQLGKYWVDMAQQPDARGDVRHANRYYKADPNNPDAKGKPPIGNFRDPAPYYQGSGEEKDTSQTQQPQNAPTRTLSDFERGTLLPYALHHQAKSAPFRDEMRTAAYATSAAATVPALPGLNRIPGAGKLAQKLNPAARVTAMGLGAATVNDVIGQAINPMQDVNWQSAATDGATVLALLIAGRAARPKPATPKPQPGAPEVPNPGQLHHDPRFLKDPPPRGSIPKPQPGVLGGGAVYPPRPTPAPAPAPRPTPGLPPGPPPPAQLTRWTGYRQGGQLNRYNLGGPLEQNQLEGLTPKFSMKPQIGSNLGYDTAGINGNAALKPSIGTNAGYDLSGLGAKPADANYHAPIGGMGTTTNASAGNPADTGFTAFAPQRDKVGYAMDAAQIGLSLLPTKNAPDLQFNPLQTAIRRPGVNEGAYERGRNALAGLNRQASQPQGSSLAENTAARLGSQAVTAQASNELELSRAGALQQDQQRYDQQRMAVDQYNHQGQTGTDQYNNQLAQQKVAAMAAAKGQGAMQAKSNIMQRRANETAQANQMTMMGMYSQQQAPMLQLQNTQQLMAQGLIQPGTPQWDQAQARNQAYVDQQLQDPHQQFMQQAGQMGWGPQGQGGQSFPMLRRLFGGK